MSLSRLPSVPLWAFLVITAIGAVVDAGSVESTDDRPSIGVVVENIRSGSALDQAGVGETVEVELVEGEIVTVGVDASAGDVLRVVIDQRGVDVETTWKDVSGTRLGRIDSFGGNEGLEVGSAVVPESGRLFLELRAGLSDSDGSVRLTVEGGAPRAWLSNDADFLAATLATEGASNEELLAVADRFLQIARTAGAIGDPLQQVCARLSAVSILNRLGEAERVLEILENQESAPESGIARWPEAKRLESLGIAYQRRREHREALEYFMQTLEIYRNLGYRRSEGYVLVRIRRCHLWLGELEAAMKYAEQGLNIWETMGDTGWQASAMEDMGMLSSSLGRLDRALEIYEASLPLWRASGNVKGEAETQYLIGKIHFKIGDFDAALDHHRQALTLMQGIEDHHGMAQTYSYLADVHQALGDLQEAIDSNEKAVAETLAGDGTWEGLARIGLGRALLAAGDSGRAREEFESALAFFREDRIRWAEGMTLSLMGSIYAARGEDEGAMEAYAEALKIAGDYKDRPREALALELMAASLLETGRIEEATAHSEAACALWRALGESGRLAGALQGLAAAREAAGKPAEAVPLIEESLRIRERTRGRMASGEDRAIFVGLHRDGYEQLVDLLLRRHELDPKGGFLEKAFETSERARARGLVELLAQARIDIRRGVDPELKRREHEIERRISKLQAGLILVVSRADAPKNRIEALSADLREAEADRRELEIELRRKNPRYADLRYPRPMTLDQARELLDDRTALLEYLVGREGSVLFVVLRDRILSFKLPPEARLADLVDRFRRAVSTPSRRSDRRWLQAGGELWSALLEPALPAIDGIERLIVVPDGPLFALPFEALIPPSAGSGGPAVDVATLPYAGLRWIFSSVSSAGVLAGLRREGTPEKSSTTELLVAFGDPLFLGEGENSGPNRERGNVEELVRGVFGRADAWPLPRLESSAVEVRSIAELFAPSRRAVFLRAEATEENAKRVLDGVTAGAVHFATHALVSPTDPERSGLVLTLDEDAREDGILQVFEIFNMRFDADLVVLSACETGLGKTVRGEGVLGLNRAFLFAGARSTIVSLWQVADASTARLMEAFYGRLAAGDDRALALQQAKIELIRSGRSAHPFYWAPFVLTGDPGLAELTENKNPLPLSRPDSAHNAPTGS